MEKYRPLARLLGFVVVSCFGVIDHPIGAHGQTAEQRNQLGKRLRRFEESWQFASPEVRALSTPSMEKAVACFFSLQIPQAARYLDEAWMIVAGIGDEERRQRQEWNAHFIDVERVWLDSTESALRLRILPMDGQTVIASDPTQTENQAEDKPGPELAKSKPLDGNLTLEWISEKRREGTSENEPRRRHTWSNPTVGEWLELPLLDTHEGAVTLDCFFERPDGLRIPWLAESIVIVDPLGALETRISDWLDQNRRNKPDTRFMSTKFYAKEIAQALKGKENEIDPPWHSWKEHLLQLMNPDISLPSLIENSTSRQFWFHLANDEGNQVVRMFIPTRTDGDGGNGTETFPVVFALHGAGGSENMFFETYGAGRLIELADEKHWIVVAPRQNILAGKLGLNVTQILDELSNFVPVDRNQVAILGHSMGAAQTIAQTCSHPDAIQAVVAMGGGGRVARSEALTKVPFFVAAGTRDFGRPGAMALTEQLRQAKCEVVYRDYENVEHMVIVQAALDDATDFIEKAFASRGLRSR
ncbi:MAG: hypothetical protein WCI02_17015 [Planctomycetota bacterium]